MKTIIKFSIFIVVLFFLTACQSSWKIDVDLTAAEREQYEQNIVDFKLKIKNFDPENTSDTTIPFYVEVGRAQENLGQLGDALKTYQKAKKIYPRSQAIENNIGRLYERVGEYEKAVEQYLYIAEEFQEPRYIYDVTWVYIKTKDRKNAEKYFNIWQLTTQKTDLKTQQAIKKLRKEEKNN